MSVHAASGRYDVVVGAGVLDSVGVRAAGVLNHPRAACMLVDAGVGASARETLERSCAAAGIAVSSGRFTLSEQGKSLATLGRMLAQIMDAKLERSQPVIALGGGILGDMAGFAAASYRRGVPWINCPSTLLAMVDASVGGKTGVNLAPATPGDLKKNMVGAFWQPSLVVADITLLASLPDRHMRCGLAECVKHGMLAADWGDPTLGEWTERNLAEILARDPDTLIELVARNIAVKARVVATDERELAPDADAGRALLNLGHTFGHAFEPIAGLSPTGDPSDAPLQHGEAVALGLVAATTLAGSLGLVPTSRVDELRAVLNRIGLPTRVTGMPSPESVVAAMQHDKKVASGRLRLIVPCSAGRCKVVVDPPREAVLGAIRAVSAERNS